jgi:3-keto-disaccharide hydrolase
MLASAMLCCVLAGDAAESTKEQEPVVIDPGPVGGPPSDAIVLFDGKDLSQWKGEKGGEAKWKVMDGFVEVNGTGSIVTKQEFGDVQLHVEWATPVEVKGEGQGRGNSGVYLQGRYEIQVLDSYQNKTYPKGQAGAFYLHSAPLVNASRKPGEWQSYDIIFRGPKKGPDGKAQPGSFTVLHNGVLVQDHVPVQGDATTAAMFQGVVSKGPLVLQDHGNPVRYRNIWIRQL